MWFHFTSLRYLFPVLLHRCSHKVCYSRRHGARTLSLDLRKSQYEPHKIPSEKSKWLWAMRADGGLCSEHWSDAQDRLSRYSHSDSSFTELLIKSPWICAGFSIWSEPVPSPGICISTTTPLILLSIDEASCFEAAIMFLNLDTGWWQISAKKRFVIYSLPQKRIILSKGGVGYSSLRTTVLQSLSLLAGIAVYYQFWRRVAAPRLLCWEGPELHFFQEWWHTVM